MIRFTSALYFVLILLTVQTSVAEKLCVEVFPPYKVTENEKQSIDNSILALAQLKLNLDQAQASGKHSVEFTVLSTNYKEKEQELQRYLERQGIMSQAELLQRIKLDISELQTQDKKQVVDNLKEKELESKRKEQALTLIKSKTFTGEFAIFHRIQPGTFEMGEPGETVTTTITKPFEMMATLTTQTIWKKVLDIYSGPRGRPHHHPGTNKFTFPHPLKPVDTKTHDQVNLWIDALNELSRAQAPELETFIMGHKAGDVYRLPTDAEWEFVARARGEMNKPYSFGDSREKLAEYAWFRDNSNQTTQPVAQLKPFVVDGNEFYDMTGNAYQWVQDWWNHKLQGGLDPQGSQTSFNKVVRGAAFDTAWNTAKSYSRSGINRSEERSDVSFRLVREVRP